MRPVLCRLQNGWRVGGRSHERPRSPGWGAHSLEGRVSRVFRLVSGGSHLSLSLEATAQEQGHWRGNSGHSDPEEPVLRFYHSSVSSLICGAFAISPCPEVCRGAWAWRKGLPGPRASPAEAPVSLSGPPALASGGPSVPLPELISALFSHLVKFVICF